MNSYYANGAEKLHRTVRRILNNRCGDVDGKDVDEFYSVANDVFTNIVLRNSYDPSKGDFEGFLYRALDMAIIDELKYQNRDKRRNKVEVLIDGERRRIAVPDVCLDMPVDEGDGLTIGDTLQSDFDMESALYARMGEPYDERTEQFLNSLSKVERRLLELKAEGRTVSEIKRLLGLSNKAYLDCVKSVRENRWITLFNTKHKTKQYTKAGGMTMGSNNWMRCENDGAGLRSDNVHEDAVMDMDTADSYRTDKYTLGSLLDDKAMGYIDCNYISQRQPFQWNEGQVNKFYSRILNNQPIPEIIICEKVVDGQKISYLVEGLQRLSYAEEFRENRIPVRAKGAEFTRIKYRKFELDDKGGRVQDEAGRPKFTVDTFDIVGKYYRDLPEFLQRRFDNFNITVTRFFNCTSEMIDYHMRNYNNHVAMTKAQYGITNVSNRTSGLIRNISERHPFFKDNIRCTSKNRKKGALDEVVVRMMMAMYYLDDWKKELIDALKFIDKHSTDEQFAHLEGNLDRLAGVVHKSVEDLFNTTNAYIWLAVFDRFEKLGIEDIQFVEFMDAFKASLHSRVIDGRSYDSVNTRNTRDKATVVAKITMITALMEEYFLSENTKNPCENTCINCYDDI